MSRQAAKDRPVAAEAWLGGETEARGRSVRWLRGRTGGGMQESQSGAGGEACVAGGAGGCVGFGVEAPRCTARVTVIQGTALVAAGARTGCQLLGEGGGGTWSHRVIGDARRSEPGYERREPASVAEGIGTAA